MMLEGHILLTFAFYSRAAPARPFLAGDADVSQLGERKVT
jgi:hypothetical protein